MPLFLIQQLLLRAALDPARTPGQQVEAARRFWLGVRQLPLDAELDDALARLSRQLVRIANDSDLDRTPHPGAAMRLLAEMAAPAPQGQSADGARCSVTEQPLPSLFRKAA